MKITAPDICTDTEVQADLDRRRHMANLRRLATRLDRDAATNSNMTCDPKRNRWGHQLADEAFAIRWALLQLDPMTEGPRQILDEIVKVVEL
jgi:hypothetical protein